MTTFTTRDGTDLYYNDWGDGPAVVLIHGWPLDADMWSTQALALAAKGNRVIAYDRRGFGRSSQPWSGYDYDTLSDDLAALIAHLDLGDVTLVGFSMGGGEVARYLGRHGGAKVARAALISAVTPFLVKTADNPAGVDQAVFDGMIASLAADRAAFLGSFGPQFYGNTMLRRRVSSEVLQWTQQMAMMGSLQATIECVRAFSATDFRPDMAAFTMPTLVIHGTADTTVPIDSSARIAARMIPGSKLIEYDDEPHGLTATAGDRVTADLLAFMAG
jgi:pimeloyl-ACP methyl ester carboxylesterase